MVCGEDTVGELKRRICEQTNVQPKRQKLLNLKDGARPAGDDTLLSQLAVKPTLKIMMMGTVEDEIFVDQVSEAELVDDLDLPEEETVEIRDRPENQRKLQRRAAKYKFSGPGAATGGGKLLSPPRPGKKLLVLDIDYTLFDHRSTAESPLELMRPHLHEFLSASYAEYDIMIWSATSMRWVELKMKELGVLGHESYRITALVDSLAMISVHSPTRGVLDCKPLEVIWANFPEHYGAANTIMLDDLRRNFVMNPGNGLVVRPFRRVHLQRAAGQRDDELAHLAQYLLSIAGECDLSRLDHDRWERRIGRRPPPG